MCDQEMFVVSPNEPEYSFAAARKDYLTEAELKQHLVAARLSNRKIKEYFKTRRPYFEETEIGAVHEVKSVDTWINLNRKKYNRGHFPVGTKAIVSVSGNPPKTVTVTDVVNNGYDSWVIVTDTLNKIINHHDAYNLSWVTGIVERGRGPAIPKQDRKDDPFYKNVYNRLISKYRKPKNHYLSDDVTNLVGYLVEHHPRYIEPSQDHLYDVCKVADMLVKQGVITSNTWTPPYHFTINKKKLHRRLPKIMAHCRLDRSKTQAEHNEEMDRLYYEDMENQ